MQVRFRSHEEIEADAQHLLDRYALAKQWNPAPPVPIERLISFLGLRQEVLDLYNFLGAANDGSGELLGALCFKTGTIRVDSRIDPEDYPWLEGRFNFTYGHEVAHWVLHRDEYLAQAEQGTLFGTPPSDIVCRRSDKSERIEVQANRFARCLLLPRGLVRSVWRAKVGTGAAIASDARRRATRVVAEQFCTSIESTGYRLEELGLFAAKKQPDLGV